MQEVGTVVAIELRTQVDMIGDARRTGFVSIWEVYIL